MPAITARPLWLQWLLVSAVGGPVLAWLLARVGLTEGDSSLIALAITLVGQSLLLRDYVPKAYLWFVASLVAGLVGVTFGTVLGGLVQDAIDGVVISPVGIADVGPGRTYLGLYAGQAVGGTVFGASLALAQWLILRREFFGAGWWLPAVTVGFAAGEAIDAPLLLPGITTGLIVRLLRKRDPEAPRKNTLAVVTAALDLGAAFAWGWAFWIIAAFPPTAGHVSPFFSPASGPFLLLSGLGWLLPLAGFITGIVARRQIVKSVRAEKGMALAWIGIIVGGLSVLLFVLLGLLFWLILVVER